MLAAVVAGMRLIREAQLTPQTTGSAKVKKGDLTIVTPTDKQVEAVMHGLLRDIPGTRFVGEEGETSGEGDLVLMVDPLDGTRPFAIRLATSTVIATAVHPDRGVVIVVVGDPATGRIWTATEGQETDLSVYDFGSMTQTEPKVTRVWSGSLGGKRQAVVFTDHSLGFSRFRGGIVK